MRLKEKAWKKKPRKVSGHYNKIREKIINRSMVGYPLASVLNSIEKLKYKAPKIFELQMGYSS
jgi:hypothetical protein